MSDEADIDEKSGKTPGPAVIPSPHADQSSLSPRARLMILGGLLLSPALLGVLAFAGDRALNSGYVLRGVTLGGMEVANQGPQELEESLAAWELGAQQKPISLKLGEHALSPTPKELGLSVDRPATIKRALSEGRKGHVGKQLLHWAQHFRHQTHLRPKVVFKQAALEAYIKKLAAEGILKPGVEGGVWFDKRGRIKSEMPLAGQKLAWKTLQLNLTAGYWQNRKRKTPIEVSPTPLTPKLKPEQVKAFEKLLKRAVYHRFRLKKERGRSFVIRASRVQRMVRIIREKASQGESLSIKLDADSFHGAISRGRKRVENPPRDATFSVDSRDKLTLVPSQIGSRINEEETRKAMTAALLAGKSRAQIVMDADAQPRIDTEKAQSLGIKEEVSSFVTKYKCCKPRVKNIHRIADLIDGVIVLPGDTFSVNAHVGQRTGDNGFFLAPSIAKGEMVKTPGGGISQFATTMFNAIFNGGYEVIERKAHRYYFPRYPEGIEATLSFPRPDLIFRNDTQAGVLIKADYGKTFIRVRLFGDNGGRRVRRRVSKRFEVKRPEVEFVGDASVDPEKSRIRSAGRIGWSVMTRRFITFPDGKVKEEKRKVVYKPKKRVVRIHPCRLPADHADYSGKPCPKPPPSEDEEAGDPLAAAGSLCRLYEKAQASFSGAWARFISL